MEYVNRRWQEFTGYSAQESGRWVYPGILHPEDASRCANQWTLAADRQRSFELRHRIRRHDGDYRWFLTRAEPISGENGQPNGWIGTCTDIHDLMSANEAAHRHLEERFRAVANTTLECFAIYTTVRNEHGEITDFRTEYINPAGCANNRLSLEEQLGRGLVELMPHHATSGLFAEYCRVVETGEHFIQNMAFYEDRYDNEYVGRWFDIHVTKLGDGITAAWRDVTDRKRAQQALDESEQRFRLTRDEMELIVEFTGLGLWWNELPLGKLSWNSNVKEHFWLPPEAEVDIDRFYAILHPQDRELCRRAIEKALAERSLFDITYRTLNSEGQCKWIHARGRVHHASDGRPLRFAGLTQDVTAQKLTEEALRNSIERLQLATEAMAGLLYDYDAEAGKVWRSQGLFELLGYSVDEVPSSASWWKERIHPDDAGNLERAALEAVAGRFPVHSAEYRVRHKDGRYIWVWDRSRLIYSDEGNLVRAVGYTISIDERVRAKQALARERERLSLAQRAGRVGVFEWDIAGSRMYWTEDLNTMLGLASCGFSGTFDSIRPFVLEEDITRLEESLLRWYSARQEDVMAEYRFRVARSDALRWIRIRAKIDYDDAGRPLRMIGTAVDVTDAKRDEEALRASEAQFRQLAEAMPQIVWTAGPDGSIDYFNRKWYQLTGLPEGTAGDESWLPLLHPDDRQRGFDTWYESVRTGIPYQIEYRFRFAGDSEYRWHLGRALPIRDSGGAVVRWCGTYTDIHDQKRAQTELQEADRRKNVFLAMLAHELRNPLGPIRNAVHILRHIGSQAPQVVQARDMINRQVTHMVHLIDDLLDISRIARGKIRLRTERCDLTAIVRQTAEDYRGILASNKISLVVTVPERPIWLQGDPTRLAQIVSNILHNANKFTDPGGQVTIAMESEPRHMLATLCIQDTGIGMDAETLAGLFEPFMQAERNLERASGGLGLGLALVKGLVELHEGSLSAHSSGLGTGSTFTIRLPVAQIPAVIAPPAQTAPGRPEPLRILIIEDNQDLADSLSMLLTLVGHQTNVAYDGKSGLALALELRPHAVLCDIGLPEMDGFAVARALRQDPATQGCYLIAQTGYGQEEDQRRALEAGFDRHLTKPADLTELQRLLAFIRISSSRDPATKE